MPEYKLYYFPIRARAEVLRLLFALAEQEYEDVRVTDWSALKPKTPDGVLPVLEIDGKMYGQTRAIENYLAAKFGLNGETDEDRLLMDGFAKSLDEIFNLFPFYERDEKVKAQKLSEMFDEKYPKVLKRIEAAIPSNNKFFLNKPSRMDTSLLHAAEFIANVRTNYLDKYPKIKNVIENVKAIDSVAEWLKKRPQTAS